jgi:septal ring factor EnvC (AmiA/AmiB activator)
MPKVITDRIRAVAFLMANANAQQMANKVVETVKIQIQEQMETFNTNVETMRDAVEHVTNATRDITTKIDEIKDGLGESTDHIMEATQELKNTTHKLIEKITENKTAPHTTPAQLTNTAYTTYAAINQQNMPTALATVVTRGETTDKQMLIQTDPNKADNTLNSHTEKELIAKANTALGLMGIKATDQPTDTSFIGAKKLRNGNILYQLNT